MKTKLLKQIDDHVQAEITRLGSIKKMEIKKNVTSFKTFLDFYFRTLHQIV